MTNRVELLARLLCSCEKTAGVIEGSVVWRMGEEMVAYYSRSDGQLTVTTEVYNLLGMESCRLHGRTARYLLENG